MGIKILIRIRDVCDAVSVLYREGLGAADISEVLRLPRAMVDDALRRLGLS